MNDPVNHPKHYTEHPSGIECIEITEPMGFCLGNVIKYVWRADLNGGIQDLEKAQWYLEREIARRKVLRAGNPNVKTPPKNFGNPNPRAEFLEGTYLAPRVTADGLYVAPDGERFSSLDMYDEYVNLGLEEDDEDYWDYPDEEV